MGRAEELFARIRDKGGVEIHSMIAASFVEELFLDYKRSATPLPSRKLADEDRKNLAKAISGFANSEGGVIVWGVDCRQTPSGDVPTAAVLISDPVALKTLMDGAIGGLTLPAHSGVENVALVDKSGEGGFVITHVPVGLNVPYQALYPRQEYHIRAGSSFLPTPHAVLAGLFGKSPQPNVIPHLHLRNVEIIQGLPQRPRVNVQVSAENKGRGFADDIYCIVEIKAGAKVVIYFPYDTGRFHGWRIKTDDRERFTLRLDGMMLPPGSEHIAFELQIEIPSADSGDILLEITSGSRNGPGSTLEIKFPAKIVADIYNQYTHTSANVRDVRAAQGRADAQIKSCLGE
jgi:hypothetical protein